MNRVQIMEEAIRLTQGDRQEEYGSFLQNMETWAALLTTYIVEKYRGQVVDEVQFQLTAEDAAQFMVLNKMMRTMQPNANPKADTFIDEACYAAMAGEAAFVQEEKYDQEKYEPGKAYPVSEEKISKILGHPLEEEGDR